MGRNRYATAAKDADHARLVIRGTAHALIRKHGLLEALYQAQTSLSNADENTGWEEVVEHIERQIAQAKEWGEL